MLATYNMVNILAGKVEVGECLEVVWKGEAPFLFDVVSRFSNQIYGQTYHVGSVTDCASERILFSFSQAFSPQQRFEAVFAKKKKMWTHVTSSSTAVTKMFSGIIIF